MASTMSGHKGFLDHYHELIGTWTRKLRNRPQAEDLAHDAFVRVLENPREVIEQPRAYLHQTARNIAVDGYRREDRRQALEEEMFDEGAAGNGDPEAYVHALNWPTASSAPWPSCRSIAGRCSSGRSSRG